MAETEAAVAAGPPVYVMSKYHTSTHATDRHLTPAGVLKLSSGDCKDLINEEDNSKILLDRMNEASQCKVTWGTTISRRRERIGGILAKHPEIEGKIFCATPYEEAHATALSCKMHKDVEGVQIMVAFGGSCLHVLSVNQVGNALRPGSNVVSKGLPVGIVRAMMEDDELLGTDADFIPGCQPPLPGEGTFYTTFPLDGDLSKDQYVSIARLFDALNGLVADVEGGGSFLVCGAPTNINPGAEWWPDKSPRAVKTSFNELALLSGRRQVKNTDTGIATGGLLCDRHQVELKDTGRTTTAHEMVLTAMAAPRLATAAMMIASGELPGLGMAMEHFGS